MVISIIPHQLSGLWRSPQIFLHVIIKGLRIEKSRGNVLILNKLNIVHIEMFP